MANKINAVKLGVVAGIFLLTPAIMQAAACSVNAGATHQVISGFGACSQWVESKITASLATQFWADDNVNGHAGLSIIRIGIPPQGSSNWGAPCNSAKQALAINPNIKVFASPWSPPANYKNNNSTTGNNTGNTGTNPGGNTNQLSTSHYGDYATYLTNFVNTCKNTYGFNLYALSVQNEPDYDTTYDSCVWSNTAMDTFIGTNLGPALQAAGYTNIIMMPESFACNLAMSATTMGNANSAKYVKVVGEHLYGANGGSGTPNPIPASYSTTAGHPVEMWETEYSMKTSTNDITSGIYYANSLHKCVVDNNYNAWCYWWLVLSSGTDDEGLCDANGTPTKRLYTLGNYSKFVRPGYVRIDATAAPTSGLLCSAYQDPVSGKFAIVVINQNSSSTSQQFNLSGLSATTVTPWLTDASNNLVAQSAVPVSANSFTYNIPAQCVISFAGAGGPLNTPTRTLTINPAWTKTFTPTVTPTVSSILLDDMEDGNNINNWGGNWYSYSGTGTTITPIPSNYSMTAGGMPGSTLYRAQIIATVADYAGLGTNLNLAVTAVDLTNYTAVEFWVKGNGASTYWFQFTQADITSGDCYGVSFTAPAAWTKVTVPIAGASLGRRGFGTETVGFENNAVIALQWASNANGALDIEVDNVQLLTNMAMTPTNSPTVSRTPTYTFTRTPSNTFTRTPVNTPTYTYTVTRTNTAANTLTDTPVSTFTYTGTCTRTPVNTATGTNTTTPPPTYTNTPVNTPTYTATKTNTPVNTATNTLITTPTSTPAGTLTNTPVVTLTNTPLNTATSTYTVTSPPSKTNTPVNTSTNTVIATPTSTPQGTLTGTPVVTMTNTRVNTATNTSSASPTSTFTVTPTWTRTSTYTSTLTVTPTRTRTSTYTFTFTVTPSFTPTGTRTQQPTNTCTATNTPTLAPSGRTAIEDVIIYPNPVPLDSDLKLLVRISGCPAEINLRLYTTGFRLVTDKTWKTGLSYPVSDLSVPAIYLNKLANGSYYYVLSLTGCDRTKAQTRKGVLLMLR